MEKALGTERATGPLKKGNEHHDFKSKRKMKLRGRHTGKEGSEVQLGS